MFSLSINPGMELILNPEKLGEALEDMGFKQISPDGGGHWVLYAIYILYTSYIYKMWSGFNFELCKIKLTLTRAPLGCHIPWISWFGIWDAFGPLPRSADQIPFARQAQLLEEAEVSKEQRKKLLADIEEMIPVVHDIPRYVGSWHVGILQP